VKHLIMPDRLSPEYIISKSEWHGRSQYLFERMYHIRGGWCNALWCLLQSRIRTLFARSRGALSEKTYRAWAAGYLKQWWKGLFGSAS